MAKKAGGAAGRFVTLRSGQVVFIPKGRKSKWADVRDKIKGAAPTPTTAMKQVPGGGLREPKTWEKKGRLAARRHLDWEKAGLKPGDFGVESWKGIDPEVVEQVLRDAAGG